jgi:peptide-methionine (S)-S-oxide reductase
MDFAKKYPGAMLSTAVGFMGDETAAKNPTYRQVCSGESGHVEVQQ